MLILVFVHLLAVCIWVGGLVAVAVVARVARRELAPAARVAFFRSFGRSYGVVGGLALMLAMLSGAALLVRHGWDRAAFAASVLAAGLVAVTVVGVLQARGMTRLRQEALRAPTDQELGARVGRGARRAAVLRAAIGALTLVLLVFGTVLTT